jgi:hypothetical protein
VALLGPPQTPAAQGADGVMRRPQTYWKINLFLGCFGLRSVLVTEVSTLLRDMGETSLIIVGDPDYRVRRRRGGGNNYLCYRAKWTYTQGEMDRCRSLQTWQQASSWRRINRMRGTEMAAQNACEMLIHISQWVSSTVQGLRNNYNSFILL